MRIRNRKGLLVSSSSSSHLRAVSETSSDPKPQLNQPKTTPHELHPIPTNHFQVKPQTHSKPSDDSSHQPPFLLPCLRPSNIHNNHTHTSGINQKVTRLSWRTRHLDRNKLKLELVPVNESWFDADKKIPPGKKRKGLALEKMSPETAMFEKAKKMKPKINNKCSATGLQQVHVEQDKAGNDDSNSTNHDMNVDKKINKRGGEIKEGSRCSRVNGRGWRCGQQTLMGYSLCEHHLG
ncbi:uncharacterized protein LOC141712573 isoform X3 [Apium graveolens]|uniref:uncharacterized protein LOC141712573 isoform X3 n=1 Tax=Apium graveolens TaxID=4045 RepID=UPI003D7B80D8